MEIDEPKFCFLTSYKKKPSCVVMSRVGPLLPFKDFTSVFAVPWIGYRPVAG